MNEYVFVLTDPKGSTDYRVINAVDFKSAVIVFLSDDSCDDLLIEKVYSRLC